MNHILVIAQLLRTAAGGWIEHRAQRLGASLAFYTTLALAPLSIIAMVVAGYFFGEDAARGGIVDQIDHLVGRDGAILIESLIAKASEPRQSRIATAISVVLLFVGATGVFIELKDALDTIWEVKPRPGHGLWTMAKTQLLAFAVVVSTGFLLLVSLLLTVVLTAFTEWLGQHLPVPVWMAYLLDLLVSFLLVTFLFALLFKLLPDVWVSWNSVGIGAVVTAVLFMLGKYLIGVYIRRAGIGSIYGAAGSLVVVLVWTYYSALILFFGAELIRAYDQRNDPRTTSPH